METFKMMEKERISLLPKTPGVYCFKNSSDKFLYIGKAANLRARVKNHFFQPSYRDDLFIDQVSKIGYLKTGSEIEALILETNLIKKYDPKFNVIWRDDKQYFYVGFTKQPLPVIFLTHQPSGILNRGKKIKVEHIGPFTDGKSLKRTLRLLRRIFPYYSQMNHPNKPCPYCHLGLCPGPEPDQKEYRRNVLKLKAVLKGRQKKVFRDIKKEMQAAVKKEDFEKAAQSRDQMQSLENIFEHARVMPSLEAISQDSLWNTTEKSLKSLLGINQRISRIEAYDISDIQGQEATASMVTFINGIPDKNYYRQFKIRTIKTPNDIAMLKECFNRRLKHLEWPYPDIILVDGGRAQLNAINSEMEKAFSAFSEDPRIKNKRIFSIALAKRKNEIYITGRKEPVLAKSLPRELFNLTLRLRDEAHRFARKYHHKLRKKSFI